MIFEQKKFLNKSFFEDKKRLFLLASSYSYRQLKKTYVRICNNPDSKEQFEKLYYITNGVDSNKIYRFINRLSNIIKDYCFFMKNRISRRLINLQFSNSPDGYVSAVCIIKNECRYIDEWCCFYKIVGMDHIYIFDNGSEDDTPSVLNKWIENGFVTVIRFPGKLAQLPAYRLAAKCLKTKYRWVAFIDIDEFMIPVNPSEDLKRFFQKKEQYPAIGVNWVVYGPDCHEVIPEGLVISNYLSTFEDRNNILNLRIKTVADPSMVYDITSPHFCILKNSKYAVDENGHSIDTKWMYLSNSGPAFTGKNNSSYIRINHYWTKSKEELRNKCNRGYSASFSPDYEKILARLNYPQTKDDIALRYVEDISNYMNQIND